MSKQLENVNHNYIRYANCWEDADVLLKALDIQSTDRVLSIASAGDNSFSLLSQNPKLVVAVDINSIQLCVLELKKAAFKALNHAEFLAFLGFDKSISREKLFQKVRVYLTPEQQIFWEFRLEDINAGIIFVGKFERYFELFRKRVLPLIHTKKRIANLFVEKTAEEQKRFFDKKWNNIRWRLLFKIFFSKLVMGKFGRDPAFLKEVAIPVSEFIIEKSKVHLSKVNAQNNYFLRFIMEGQFGQGLPHYARKENFDAIKKNIDRLVVFQGLAEEAFEQFNTFTKFNLSNIFEYMDLDLFTKVSQNLIENGSANARYAYWNLMVPRKMTEVSELIEGNEKVVQELREIDNGFFYTGINVDTKK